MGRRRKVILAIALFSLVVVLALVFWPRATCPEPIYKGRKLSDWLIRASKKGQFSGEDTEAIQAIGVKGLPCYLEWMSYEPGALKRGQFQLAAGCEKVLHVDWVPESPEITRAWFAFSAFCQLREDAAPTIPRLVSWATNLSTWGSNFYSLPSQSAGAIEGLAAIGRPAVPAFISLVTNRDAGVRAFAISRSQRFHLYGDVILELKKAQSDPDKNVRTAATNALKAYDRNTSWLNNGL